MSAGAANRRRTSGARRWGTERVVRALALGSLQEGGEPDMKKKKAAKKTAKKKSVKKAAKRK